MSITPRRELISVLKGAKVEMVPIVSIFQTATLELMEASKAYLPEAHMDPKLMTKLAVAAHSVAHLECVRIPFSAAVEASAFGCKINWGDRRCFPDISAINVKDEKISEIEASRPSFCDKVVQAVKILRKQFSLELPIIAGVQGPFTLAGMVLGAKMLLKNVGKEPNLTRCFIDNVTNFLNLYIANLVQAGTDVVAIIENLGSGYMIGEKNFVKFVEPYINQLTSEMDCPTILHIPHPPDIIGKPLRRLLKKADTSAFCLEWGVDIINARKILGDDVILAGNIDPIKLLRGSVEDVKKHVERIIQDGIDILSPGCDLQPETPTKNIIVATETAVKHVRKK